MAVRLTVEKAVLLVAALFVVVLIARYDVCFQDSEVFSFDRTSVVNGVGLSIGDIATAFRVMDMEGEPRPRFLSHLAMIVTIKTRLALWRVLPPHPSFSPVWLLTLLGPVLLFKFLEIELGDRPAAAAGVAVYLVSAGFLSGITMLFHPGKPLTTALVIAVLYVSARLSHEWSRSAHVALVTLLSIAPFVDETAVFAYAIPLLWCRRLPKRTYLIPAAFTLLVLVMMPAFPSLMGTGMRRLGFAGYLARMAQAGLESDGWRFDLRHIIWNAGNLVIPQMLPWRVAGTVTPVVSGIVLPIAPLVGLGTALSSVTWLVHRTRVQWPLYRRLLGLVGVFVVFQTLVLVFHPQQLSATGFYYGAVFSVIFAALAGATYATIRQSPGVRWMARPLLVWVVTISAVNFLAINATWMLHSNTKTLDDIDSRPWYHTIGDWRRFDELRFGAHPVLPHAPEGQYTESPDDERRSAREHFADAMEIWRNWREGRADFAGTRPLSFRQLWLINELALTRTQ